MPLFKDAKDLQSVFDPFLKEVIAHPIIGPKLARAKMIVRFEYTDPETQVTINLTVSPPTTTWGDSPLQADVTFKQSADFSNRFWQGKENVIAAMAKRQVTAKGSIPKALQLIPVIRPAFRLYPQVVEKLGRKNLLEA